MLDKKEGRLEMGVGKIRVLLVAPLQDDAQVQNWGAPSLGLMRIDSYIRARLEDRIETIVYDRQIDRYDPFEKLRDEKIDILGISILHYTLVNSFAFLHRWKREHPETIIVAGGNEASANYQDIFDKSPCDAVALVEGEDEMLELILWKLGERRLEDIDGLVWRKYARTIDNDRFWTYWEHLDFAQYRYPDYWRETARLHPNASMAQVNTVRLVTSSHCQRACTFCSLALVRSLCCGGPVAPVALQGWQVMELVHRIHRQVPGTRTIYFCTDDVFYPDKEEFYRFIELYEKSGYDYRILVQTSTFSLTEAEFPLLQRLGCDHVTIGVENASARIRKSLKKPQDTEKIEQIIGWSKKYQIPAYFLIILFPPESTLEDLRINYAMLKHWISLGVTISIEPICYVYRGTPLYEDDRYDFLWQRKKIEGTNLYYKDSIYVLPRDPAVRELALEFKRREPEFVAQAIEKLGHEHYSKDVTGRILVELLGVLLEEYMV